MISSHNSIMDAIFASKRDEDLKHHQNQHHGGIARSQAFSTKSVFSNMNRGMFFKIVDSPFKSSMINAYEKIQNKNGGGVGGTVYNGMGGSSIRNANH